MQHLINVSDTLSTVYIIPKYNWSKGKHFFFFARCGWPCVSAVHLCCQSFETNVNTRCEWDVKASHIDVESLYIGDM